MSFSGWRMRAESMLRSVGIVPSSAGAASEDAIRLMGSSLVITTAHVDVSALGIAAQTSSIAALTLRREATVASKRIWPRRSTRPLNGRMESISTPSTACAAVIISSAMVVFGRSRTMSSITVPSGKFSTMSTERISASISPRALAKRPRLPGVSGRRTRTRYDICFFLWAGL